MVHVVGIKLELYLCYLISTLAYSLALHDILDDQLHNQLISSQQKRANGFVPMRGRKNDQEIINGIIDRNAVNEKEVGSSNLASNGVAENGATNNLDLIKTLNNFLKLNNNGNLEEQLNLLDQNFNNNQPINDDQYGFRRFDGYELRRPAMFNQRSYSQQVSPFLSLVTRYGSPKRAGFVPMRGRKNDPNILVRNDEDEDSIGYSPKRAGFLPMRGKKNSMEYDDLVNQFNQKRAFHALRG